MKQFIFHVSGVFVPFISARVLVHWSLARTASPIIHYSLFIASVAGKFYIDKSLHP